MEVQHYFFFKWASYRLYRKRPPRIVNRTVPKIITISVHTLNRFHLSVTCGSGEWNVKNMCKLFKVSQIFPHFTLMSTEKEINLFLPCVVIPEWVTAVKKLLRIFLATSLFDRASLLLYTRNIHRLNLYITILLKWP